MIVKQISVFLENKPGQLLDVVNILADNKIDMRALSVAEAMEYGVMRAIVDKPEETEKILREQNWICSTTDVLAVTVPDTPGSLSRLLTVLADHGISLAYSYAFLARQAGNACIVLRVDDNAAAQKLLLDAGIEC